MLRELAFVQGYVRLIIGYSRMLPRLHTLRYWLACAPFLPRPTCRFRRRYLRKGYTIWRTERLGQFYAFVVQKNVRC